MRRRSGSNTTAENCPRGFTARRFSALTALAVVILAAGPAGIWAEDISIQANVHPQRARVGEHLQLVVTVEGKANLRESPQLPDLQDFQVYGGGRSSNFTFVNGQVSSTLQFTYVLVPKRAGQLVVGPVQITYQGKSYSTQPIPVVVSNASQGYSPSAPAGAAPAPPAAIPGAKPGEPAETPQQAQEAVFITTASDRKSVYVNEPLVLHFRFFSRIPILSQPQYQPADTSGFWAEDLPPQREYTTRLNGQEYRVIEIRQVLFPTTSGDLTIGPAHLIVQVQDFQHRMRDPFADSFFRDFFSSGQRVTLQSKPIGVHVKPIPDSGRPPDFTGTVGSWSLSARLDRNEAKVGEAVTLEIRIFGEGNVKSVGKPQLPPLTGFKVYETVSSSEVQKKEDAIQGVKIYRTLLRPEVSGTLSIPPIAYSYFNPRAGKFERVQVPSLALRVLPGDQDVSALAALAP